jgi:iron complex transport system permease protein
MAERGLVLLGVVLALACAMFLFWGLKPPYGFILSLRGAKLAALLLVGAATGAATVLFQTVAANRLLTPGIVGFDQLFIFLQTMLVLLLGVGTYATLPRTAGFLIETAVLMAAAMALFGLMLRRGAEDVIRMILTGVILGALLRGLAGFAQRILDPSEFAVVQQAMFASFGAVRWGEILPASVVLIAALWGAWALSRQLDVAALGRLRARTLGLDHDRLVMMALALTAAMVAVSTALVGPLTFLGLLAASLAHVVIRPLSHALLIPAASMIGALILVAGQFVFERLLGYQSTLAVLVEFFGGLLFLALVLKRRPT